MDQIRNTITNINFENFKNNKTLISALPLSLSFLVWAFLEYKLTWWWPFTLAISFLSFLLLSALMQEFLSLSFHCYASLDRKDTCLITGATHGIGYALAKRFATDSYNLILVARYEEELKEAKRKLQEINSNITIIIISKDLYTERGADELYEEVKANPIMKSKQLRLNNIINNVGICIRGDFLELPLIDQLGQMQLNMMNTVKLTHLFGNDFKYQIANNKNNNIKYRLMITSSFASLIVSPFLSVYSGTKSFLHAFSLSFNEELKASKYKNNISCTSLCPGYTLTPALLPSGIQNSVALKLGNSDTTDRVAFGGYRAMMEGKPYVLIGFLNNLTYWTTCFIPVAWTAKMGKFFSMDWDELSLDKLKNEGMQVKKGWTENQPASRDLRSSLAQQ